MKKLFAMLLALTLVASIDASAQTKKKKSARAAGTAKTKSARASGTKKASARAAGTSKSSARASKTARASSVRRTRGAAVTTEAPESADRLAELEARLQRLEGGNSTESDVEPKECAAGKIPSADNASCVDACPSGTFMSMMTGEQAGPGWTKVTPVAK
ncbi:MAG: hypothetical protein LBL52_03500 [Rickettsiales bacterium]|jgi:hypothetical protein|nr:hypothetical protein [Rickettsiales bacterium]